MPAARSSQARAQAEQVAINYQKVVQGAFRDVADALAGIEEGARQGSAVDAQRAASNEARRITRLRYDAGHAG